MLIVILFVFIVWFCRTVKIVDTIGAEDSLKMLYITEDLEEAGGMMTLVSRVGFCGLKLWLVSKHGKARNLIQTPNWKDGS